jgi:uncharacterized membrane protein (GlpM family)
MFWVTFLVSGLIVASIPWVASHFSNRIAGYVVLLPVMMLLSFTVQYLSNGQKATVEMIYSTIWALPTLLVFGLVALLLLKQNVTLPIAMSASLGAWLVSVMILNAVISK